MFSEALKTRMVQANSVVVLTGAGVSEESGVPTFRGEHGLWKKFKPEELANFDSFIKNPELVWEWYSFRKQLILNVKPNSGHFAIAEMERHFKLFHLITQNVDGLHDRAGNQNIIELHGNIMGTRCLDCGKRSRSSELTLLTEIPKCICGGMLRPDVVWFGENLPGKELSLAISVSEKCDLFFSIGTSAVVYPAASLPGLAKRCGAYVVEINKDPTAISNQVDESILGKSGEILPKLIKESWES